MSTVVTFAQARERAERWINADVPGHRRRDVRLREFGLGFVAWTEDDAGGPGPDGGRSRLVITRDGGDATLWPGLPVDEVIRRYEEEYGTAPEAAAAPAPPPQRTDLEATSFLLTPPEWLQEAADRLGVPDRRTPAAEAATAPGGGGSPWDAADTSGSGDGREQQPHATVLAPPLSGSDEDDTTPPPAESDETPTAFLAERGALPPTAVAPTLDSPGTPGAGAPHARGPQTAGPQAPGPQTGGPQAGGAGAAPGSPPPPPSPPVAPPAAPSAARQTPKPSRGGPSVPPPPGPPPAPGTGGPATGGPTAGPRTERPDGRTGPNEQSDARHPDPAQSSGGNGELHHTPTMPASPGPGGTGTPPPPGPPPGSPGPPGPPGGQAPGTPQGPAAPPAYGHAHQPDAAPVPPPGTPTVGPGYMAVLRYRAPDGSEQQLIRRSAPGIPHPEWQILHELRALNVPPQQVLELHTELESCDLPGGYCARMIRENWPQVRVSHTAAYGTDHASRQQGMRHLVEHQGELHQVADAPPRPAPQRVPLPPQHQIQPAPPIPPDAIGHELAQAFGPQAVFRFDQHAVSRQGVPDIVGQVLVWAGVPVEVTPFFRGQAQPGRPVPTLAELARERGLQPASDAGSYLVMGNDFGRQICVQYGTAHLVAVPLEAGPDGQSAPPQFVNTGLPEFVRCLALLGRMWRLRYGLTPEQAGRWTVDFQMQLAMLDPAALSTPENWWSVLLEQMWDGLF